MRTIKCVVSCPIDVYSGYSGRSRDIVKELIRIHPDWDISILSQRWGDCRFGFLEEHREFELMSRLIDHISSQPDIWIQITVPNEFQRVGKFNIGITAAMETNLCDLEWVKGCNRMDLVLTSSEHGKRSLVDSKWIMNDTQEIVSVTTPVEVIFEGLDISKFFLDSKPKKSKVLDGIKNSWNFLCVGHWMQGDLGEDRKNIGLAVKYFLEAFKDTSGPVPGLILKTCQAKNSVLDREEILRRIRLIQKSVRYEKSLPRIYLLSGDLTDSEMNEVYNDPRVKAMVTLTKGEGFGRPLLEFAATGKPIIASGWSGHLDFLTPSRNLLIGGKLEKVHPSAVVPGMILAEAMWFSPDESQSIRAYQDLFARYEFHCNRTKGQSRDIRENWTLEAMGDVLKATLDKYLPEFPEEVKIQLPGLEGIQ